MAIITSSCATQKVMDPKSTDPRLVTESKIKGSFEVIPFLKDLPAKRTRLSNGLTLTVVEDESSPTFAYQTWFNIGSKHEVPGKTGLAHLFEHMMFKGTKLHRDGEFDSLLEGAGVEGENAYTNNDRTVYVQELPKKELDLIIHLESDRLVNLQVDDASFNTEREVVKNERRFRTENSPEGVLQQLLFETAFQHHPYRWPVIGYEQDLNVMNAQDAREFYEKFYSPDRATIVVVGDVDAESVLKKVITAYGSLLAKNTPDPIHEVEPKSNAQKRKRIQLNMENSKLWMVFQIGDQDREKFEIIQTLLTDGNASRLERALVDSGVASDVTSGSLGLHDTDLFLITVDLQNGKSPLAAESIVLRELERLKKSPVSPDELDRARNLNEFQYLTQLGTAYGKARFIGQSEHLFGHVIEGLRFRNKTLTVTAEEIQQTVAQYFRTQSMTIITGDPK